MFLTHTESIGGKGVDQLYHMLKKLGHDVKIVILPWIRENQLLSEVDINFAKKFSFNDVIYPCGQRSPYQTCQNLSDYGSIDYIFTQNPYQDYAYKDSILDPFYLYDNLKKVAKKIGFIVYGPHIFHQDFINDIHLKNYIDTVFVDSESTRKIYIERYRFPSNKVVVSGYPEYKTIRDNISKYQKKDNVETILWLPRWTLNFKNRELYEGGSTFLNYHYFFYNYAQQNPHINFIIRPHQLLYSSAVIGNFVSQMDLDLIFEKFNSLKNVTISVHKDRPLSTDIMLSDIVISDGTSSLAEVVVAKKPIIYLSNGWNNEFNSNDLSQKLKSFVLFSYEPNDIMAHLNFIRNQNYQLHNSIKHSYTTIKHRTKQYINHIRCKFFNSACDYTYFVSLVDPVDDPYQFIAEYLLYE